MVRNGEKQTLKQTNKYNEHTYKAKRKTNPFIKNTFVSPYISSCLSKLALNPCGLLFFFSEHLGFPPSLFKLHSYLGKVKPPEGHEFFALRCISSLHLILLKSNHKTARVM